MIAPTLLAVLAVLLAWPVPIVLARARWTRRSPAVALVLWQAIAVAGGLSMIGALVAFGVSSYGSDIVSGSVGFAHAALAGSVDFWSVVAVAAAALLTGHLLLNLVLTVVRSERQRRRHAQLLLLLSSPHPSGSRLIDTPAPVAYCLPGAISSVTVVSAGLIALLDDDGMRAVVEHEKAHVRQRHDVVLVLFRAWHTSLPWFPIAYRAQQEVGLLIELLADDHARLVVDDTVLATAIARVGAGRGDRLVHPEQGSTLDALSVRLARLDEAPLPRWIEALVVAAAVALLAVPTILLFAPALLDLLT